MPLWQNTLSIGADDVGFHSTVGRPMPDVENISGSRVFIQKRTFKNGLETRSFSETSRSRDETETSKNRVSSSSNVEAKLHANVIPVFKYQSHRRQQQI